MLIASCYYTTILILVLTTLIRSFVFNTPIQNCSAPSTCTFIFDPLFCSTPIQNWSAPCTWDKIIASYFEENWLRFVPFRIIIFVIYFPNSRKKCTLSSFKIRKVVLCFNFNSFGAIVAQERRKVGCRDYATRRDALRERKQPRMKQNTLQIKGFIYGLSPCYL